MIFSLKNKKLVLPVYHLGTMHPTQIVRLSRIWVGEAINDPLG